MDFTVNAVIMHAYFIQYSRKLHAVAMFLEMIVTT
jgi:hypothetical protein